MVVDAQKYSNKRIVSNTNVMLCKHGRQDKSVVRVLDSAFPQGMIIVN
jgi:hypothetical protein